jgi:drug/metabolite transporter (DMT)-like permease
LTSAKTNATANADRSAPIDWLAVAAALVTVVLWASAFVGIRALADDVSPGALALGRLAIGSLALSLIVALRRPAMPPRRTLPLIVAVGVLWFGGYNLALTAAEREVDAGTAAMLVNIGPILIAVFGGLFLHEGFPARLFAGSFVAFVGAAIIGLATSGSTSAGDATLGIVLCLVAAVAYAIGVTLQKPAVATTPALTVTWLSCLVGVVACLPFAPELAANVGTAPPSAIAWLLYLGLFPTALAFTTWAYALGRTTAGRLGSTTYLVPAVAIVLGWLLLGESPAPLALLGGAVAIAGVVIARWAPTRRRAVVEPAAPQA